MISACQGKTLSAFISELQPILASQVESLKILSGSSNLLHFCVNDILDLAVIKNGKFRKNCSNFSAKEAIGDVIRIQQQKADNNQVTLGYQLEGFDGPEGRPDYIVCTDQQRFK